MEWRKEGSDDVTSRRVCPTCRKPSDYVVPAARLPSTAEEKEVLLRNYRAARAGVPCKNFDGTRGSCPFGSDCFYAHRDSKGRDIKSRDATMQELYERRQRHRDERRERDVEHITDMLIMMGMRNRLGRGERGGGRGGWGRGRGSGQPGWRDGDGDDVEDYMDFITALLTLDDDDLIGVDTALND